MGYDARVYFGDVSHAEVLSTRRKYLKRRSRYLSAGFPGFSQCMHMMRNRDPQVQEDGFGLLLPHASQYIDQLLAEFHTEEDHGLRCWLLELIGEARATKAFPLLVECLRGDDESFRTWALYSLNKMDTKESRRVLWEARSYTLPTAEETKSFQQVLERIVGGDKPIGYAR